MSTSIRKITAPKAPSPGVWRVGEANYSPNPRVRMGKTEAAQWLKFWEDSALYLNRQGLAGQAHKALENAKEYHLTLTGGVRLPPGSKRG
jgi:hypothetical protein